VALAGAVVATVLVIKSALHHSPSSRAPVTVSTAGSGTHPRSGRQARRRSQTTTLPTSSSTATYTVKSGDTLSAIAAQTGVPLATLERLNPTVNPSAMHAGERLRLR
jgi:LysM repeat protein